MSVYGGLARPSPALNHYSRATTPRSIGHMACRALESKETTFAEEI
jgi:hypothetical protein